MHQVALITGCSSGIGYETALMLARNGFHTFATMRNTKKLDSLEEIIKKERLDLNIRELDVNDDRSIENTINCVKKEANRIDVLINNAGYGLVGFLKT